MRLPFAALLAVACLSSAEAFASVPGEMQPQKCMHFPEFYDIPRTVKEAANAGWTEWNAGESCASRGGHVFARPNTHPDFRSWGLLPALIYTGWGELAGVIFALDKRFILQNATDKETAPWSHGDLRGQVKYFVDPMADLCTTTKPPAIERGMWYTLPECMPGNDGCTTGWRKAADGWADAADLNSQQNSKFADHLCQEGMGDHLTMGHCTRAFSYAFMGDANGRRVGLVNGINMDIAAMENYLNNELAVAPACRPSCTWKHMMGVDAGMPHNEAYTFPRSIEGHPFHSLYNIVFDTAKVAGAAPALSPELPLLPTSKVLLPAQARWAPCARTATLCRVAFSARRRLACFFTCTKASPIWTGRAARTDTTSRAWTRRTPAAIGVG